MATITPEDIDQLLPQTQCGLCGYNGCLPYAEALVFENAPIDLCPPGGVATLQALGALLQIDPAPYIADMQQKTKPRQLAIIREEACIGCTKCITACPVDAILGSAKQMHTVIASECTGCELCVAPCPVDCIDLLPAPTLSAAEQQSKANTARQRVKEHNKRLATQQTEKRLREKNRSLHERKTYLQGAIARAGSKKNATRHR